MNGDTFVSYAQNGEDVLLWRALGHIRDGRYVDVGAWDAVEHSVTKAFYDRGWRGVNVEPVPELAAALRDARPADEVVQAAVSTSDAGSLELHRIQYVGDDGAVTGLSTLVDDLAARHAGDGFAVEEVVVPTRSLASICTSEILGDEIHFLKIDVEGAEADALRSMDFGRFRPWVVLVEATEPLSTEQSHQAWEGLLLEADYEYVLFDGLSRYYVAAEHAELKAALSYPVCVFDEFQTLAEVTLREQLASAVEAQRAAEAESNRLWEDLVHWRNVALDSWARGFVEREKLTTQLKNTRARVKSRNEELKELEGQVEEMESSASWRVTRPLRWARSRPALRTVTRKAGRP